VCLTVRCTGGDVSSEPQGPQDVVEVADDEAVPRHDEHGPCGLALGHQPQKSGQPKQQKSQGNERQHHAEGPEHDRAGNAREPEAEAQQDSLDESRTEDPIDDAFDGRARRLQDMPRPPAGKPSHGRFDRRDSVLVFVGKLPQNNQSDGLAVPKLEFLLGKQAPYVAIAMLNFLLLTVLAITARRPRSSPEGFSSCQRPVYPSTPR
jgi:hypothetical protein